MNSDLKTSFNGFRVLSMDLGGLIVEDFCFCCCCSGKFPVPVDASLHMKTSSIDILKWETLKGFKKMCHECVADFDIPHSPRASAPVCIYIQRVVAKAHFWVILLFLRKRHMLTVPHCVSLRRGAAVHCGSRLLHSPGMKAEKEVGRCDALGSRSQQSRTWIDGNSGKSWRQIVSKLNLPSGGCRIHVHL